MKPMPNSLPQTSVSSVRVGAITPHFGEEPFFTGTHGAGTIFFTRCNLRCWYCQNWQISHIAKHKHYENERGLTCEELALEMLKLQERGCHNIDLVSPSHVIPAVVSSLRLAKNLGLRIPVLYNANAFETVEQLRTLEGLVDIYLPDLKYADDAVAYALSGIKDYVARARASVAEMFRQVGQLQLDQHDLATRGLVLRLLVLPQGLAGIEASLKYLKEALSCEVFISLMSQYNPEHILTLSKREEYRGQVPELLTKYPGLARKITPEEYEQALNAALDLGFENIFGQELEQSVDYGNPDFTKDEPFEWTAPANSASRALTASH